MFYPLDLTSSCLVMLTCGFVADATVLAWAASRQEHLIRGSVFVSICDGPTALSLRRLARMGQGNLRRSCQAGRVTVVCLFSVSACHWWGWRRPGRLLRQATVWAILTLGSALVLAGAVIALIHNASARQIVRPPG